MVHIKSHSFKFMFFVFCLSQVQAGKKRLPDEPENPFDELSREISKSVTKISDKIQLRLSQADVHADKYFDHLKENIHESVEKFQKQMCDVVQQQIERVGEELKARNPEIGKKVKKLKAELFDLKEDLMKLYEEIKKPFLERFNELRDDIRIKTIPIVKRWTLIFKDIELRRDYIGFDL
eukprot:XP_016664799.1 PREDICTED: uncharacterized protein LOC103311525 [Acyrthosiphon pisum]